MSEIFVRLKYENENEWLKLRKLGGSDASCIIGENPYKTNLQLWNELVGNQDPPNIDNPFTRYGVNAETPLRDLVQVYFVDYETNSKLVEIKHTNEVLARKDKPYMTASLDGEIEVLQDFDFTSYWRKPRNENDLYALMPPEPMKLKKGMKGILEIKTTSVLSSSHKEKWENQIPQNYYIQVLHYLNITNYDFVILAVQLKYTSVYNIDTFEMRYYGFMRNDKLDDLAYLEKEIDKFYFQVKNKVEPPLRLNF